MEAFQIPQNFLRLASILLMVLGESRRCSFKAPMMILKSAVGLQGFFRLIRAGLLSVCFMAYAPILRSASTSRSMARMSRWCS